MVKVCLNSTNFKHKPTNNEIKNISFNIVNEKVDIDLLTLAEDIAIKGKSVVLCQLLEPKLNKNTPISSQELVMLDFDNKGEYKYTIKDLLSDEFMMKNACFYYKTFSDLESDDDKFRVVFKLDKVVYSNKIIEDIYQQLFKKYPQADSSVGQTTRIFFGSNSGFEVINWVNTLEVGTEFDIIESTNDVLDLDTPIYVLMKNRRTDLIKIKFGERYSQEFPDDISAMNYLCSIDMRELLELPEGNPFIDIFHDEESPSASVFYDDKSDIYFYKCFSATEPYIGTVLNVTIDLLGLHTRTSATRYLVDMINGTINFSSDLGIQKAEANAFRKELLNGTLEKTYPELYSYLKRYSAEINLTLDFLYDYSYKDKFTGEIRYLSYFSIDKLTHMVSKGLNKRVTKDKMWNVLGLIIVTEMVQKLSQKNIPQQLYSDLIASQKSNNKQIRTSNVYEPTDFNPESIKNMNQISKIMKENNVTISSLSYEVIYRLFGEEKAKRDFPQAYEPLVKKNLISMSKKDSNLTRKSIELEKTASKILLKELEAKGYMYESELISKIARNKNSKINTIKPKYQKIRIDLLNNYDLKREKLTKELYNHLNINEKYTPKIIIYKKSL